MDAPEQAFHYKEDPMLTKWLVDANIRAVLQPRDKRRLFLRAMTRSGNGCRRKNILTWAGRLWTGLSDANVQFLAVRTGSRKAYGSVLYPPQNC